MGRAEAEARCREMFNRVGLFGGFDPCRVIGFAHDGEDFYYIVLLSSGSKSYHSMVGGFDPVEGKYTNRIWDTRIPKAESFLIENHENGRYPPEEG